MALRTTEGRRGWISWSIHEMKFRTFAWLARSVRTGGESETCRPPPRFEIVVCLAVVDPIRQLFLCLVAWKWWFWCMCVLMGRKCVGTERYRTGGKRDGEITVRDDKQNFRPLGMPSK